MQQALLIPELGARRQGKVRDIYEKGDELILVASDRISIFDRILREPIFEKGRILTELALFWFEETKDIMPNHVISHPDPNVMVVRKCTPIPIEIIVRGFMAGSIWRDYASGKREKCGIKLPEGLKQNDPLPTLIVTPTTKSIVGHDEDLTKEEIFKQKLVTEKEWAAIEEKALALYKRGAEVLKKRGMVLVDTKYEFGWDAAKKLTLIDEIHTPDSSRFWYSKDVERKEVKFPDKELVREWARGLGFVGEGELPTIDPETQDKIHKSYAGIYQAITGKALKEEMHHFPKRMWVNLKKANLIRGTYALVILGSEKDKSHAEKIGQIFEGAGIPFRVEVASAHKNTRALLSLLDTFNESLEPLVCLTIAGRSNALSGVVACNLKWPVIACPFFQDYQDYAINIHSTLQMPSKVPVLTAIDPQNAALAAVRILKTMEGLA
jgi:phosphoribosylaminoimidazole-succinocarboxamide synthase